MAILKPYKGGYYLWNYIPSVPAAIVFIVLFFLATAGHSFRMFSTRTWFCIPFVLGCLLEALGYIARRNAVNKTDNIALYIQQSCFILIAPALFAASIYMTLGRTIRTVKGEAYSVIRVNWLTKIFVIGDIFSFLIQGGGAGMMANSKSVKLGEDIVLAGLGLQLVSFGIFFISAVIFETRMNQNPTPESFATRAPWKQTLRMLYIVSILILIRSAFRIVEYVQGHDGYSLKHEWTLYAFDSAPMFIVTAVFFVWFPSRLKQKPMKDDESSGDVPLSVRATETS
ncbi:hypothetical protein EG329_007974 [Mollisiaceae sp. DMI_Dod_QoI]|nr:hypothetical protein EG329_007974 [Helotiales sp. DMI_Dod_QoI]